MGHKHLFVDNTIMEKHPKNNSSNVIRKHNHQEIIGERPQSEDIEGRSGGWGGDDGGCGNDGWGGGGGESAISGPV